MKKIPDEDEDWYCPTCREEPEIIKKMKEKSTKSKRGGQAETELGLTRGDTRSYPDFEVDFGLETYISD